MRVLHCDGCFRIPNLPPFFDPALLQCQAMLQPALVGSVLALLVATLPHRSRLGHGGESGHLAELAGGLEHAFMFPYVEGNEME